MNDKTYNGWTNYATWRVNLEIFDGMDFRDRADEVIRTYVAPRLQLTMIAGDRESRLATALQSCGD